MQPDLPASLESRRTQFLSFRWLLFIWAGALNLVQPQAREHFGSILTLLGAIALSQALLKLAPQKYLEGTKVLTAIFLLDITFMVGSLELAGKNNPGLMVALSLATVMAALSHRLSFAFLTAGVSAGVYLGLSPGAQQQLLAGPTGILVLPFLFIAAVHSSMLAQESHQEVEARQMLEIGKKQLSRHLNSTFMEIARTCKDLTALLDALPLGTLMLDEGGRVQVLNDIAEELLGLNRGEILNLGLNEAGIGYLAPSVAQAFARPNEDLISIEIQPKDGRAFPMGLGVYPIFDADHRERGILILLVPMGMSEAISKALEPQAQHWKYVRSQSSHPLAQAGQASTEALSLGALGLAYG